MKKPKTARIFLVASDDEKRTMAQAAEAAGLSLSAWMRTRLLQAAKKEIGAADRPIDPPTVSGGAPAPVAWMRRWAFDKIDVMRMPKRERPVGWAFHSTSEVKFFPDDVPLYALPPSPERGR